MTFAIFDLFSVSNDVIDEEEQSSDQRIEGNRWKWGTIKKNAFQIWSDQLRRESSIDDERVETNLCSFPSNNENASLILSGISSLRLFMVDDFQSHWMVFFVGLWSLISTVYQLRQAKLYTVEHLSDDGKYVVKIGKHSSDLIRVKIQSRYKNST